MGPHHPLPFLLLLGVLCMARASPLTKARATDDKQQADEQQMVADMLELAQADEIQAACPRPNTFCLPRVKCPVKSVIYDREGLRFVLGADKFTDLFACGAFSPTWTYVCCSTMDKLDAGDWSPTPDLWFFPPQDEASVAKNVDPSDLFPILLPWPGYEEPKVSGDNSKAQDPKKNGISEKQNERSANPQLMNPAALPPMLPFADPRMNPWQNPMANNPWAFPQPPPMPLMTGFDPRMMPVQQGLQQQMTDPRSWAARSPSDWSEMIYVYPDGSFQRIIRDPWPQNRGMAVDQRLMMEPQHVVPDIPVPRINVQATAATGQFPATRQPTTTSTTTPVAQQSEEDGSDSSSKVKRAVASKTFKVPPAKAGRWEGEIKNKTSDVEGRALLPPPTATWGMPGSGSVPLRPIPAGFNVDNERCGMSSSMGINARVLSGRKPGSDLQSETSFAEFPWHVAVVNGETGDYLCAGTIISGRFVLTVAHCVRKFQLTLLFVRVGDWDLSGTGEMFPSYDVEVQTVIVHEDFSAGNLQNDIALLQLKFPLDFGSMPHVGTICLAPSSEPIYSDCIVTGWGQQVATSEAKSDTATFSRTLKQTTQTLVTAPFCEKALRPFLGQFYQLPKKGFVCAYDKDGKDSCFGDGGGALACLVNAPNYPKTNQYHVVGLVSWGVGCGMPGVPSAYTAVWDYLDWIHNKVSPLDAYSRANPQPLKEPNPAIMVRSNSGSTPQPPPKPVDPDFIDLAFKH